MDDDAPDLLRLAGERFGSSTPDPRLAWQRIARPDQVLPPGDWRVLLWRGGRGSGKTRAGSQALAEWILSDPEPGEWGICAPTYRDAWTTCVEGPSGILAALGTTAAEVKNRASATVATAHRTYGEITLHSGHVIRVDSANDGALRIQGKNLRGLWADELGLWSRWAVAWDESISFAVRQGRAQIIATATPKISRPAAKLIRRLIRDEPGTIVRRLRTIDNAPNLSPSFLEAVVGRATGTRLERQELEGELLDDAENALWTRDLLESIQVDEIPGATGDWTGLHQVYVGADPSDGTEESDEQAYVVSGLGEDHKLYVAESWGGRVGPVPFLKRVVQAADRWHGTVVLEKNHGGAYLVATLRQVMKELGITVPCRVVHASQSKRTRAEPVAALYERGVVRHAGGPHVDLEDQMVSFTGAAGERSPDRLDAACWSMTPLLDAAFGDDATHTRAVRRWATSAQLDALSPQPRRPAALAARGRGSWDLDSFAPQDDTGQIPRPNVRPWCDNA